MSTRKEKRSKEDTWSKKDLSRELQGRQTSKSKKTPPLSENNVESARRKDEEVASKQSMSTHRLRKDITKTQSPIESPKNRDATRSTKEPRKTGASSDVTRSPKELRKTGVSSDVTRSPKELRKTGVSSDVTRSTKELRKTGVSSDVTRSTKEPQKPGVSFSTDRSPKKSQTNEVPPQKPSDSSRTQTRDKEDRKRRVHSTNQKKESEAASQKPHPLTKSHTVEDTLDVKEELEEDIPQEITTMSFDPIPMEEVTEELGQEDEGEWNYSNDEFEEDYEEDFEEDFEEESIGNDSRPHLNVSPPLLPDLKDILQAIDSENENIENQRPPPSAVVFNPTAPPPPSHLSPRPMMSFSGQSVQRAIVSRKIKTRACELANLIEHDILSINLLELQPLNEYELYMRNFGLDNTSQTSCQTGEDQVTEEIQTEPIPTQDCWTQYPPHDMKGYGGVDEDDKELFPEYDTESLLKFLQKAAQVCDTILEEEEIAENEGTAPTNSYQDQYCTLGGTLVSKGRVECLDWSHTHPDILLVGCNLKDGGEWPALLEVWQLSRPVQPQHYLGNHSSPICCCLWYPLVFAGNEDGSVVVWDLREPLSLHRQQSHSDDRVVRVPTYTTASLGWQSGHCEPVLSLTTTTVKDATVIQDQSVHGLSFQVLSLDASGKVCIWTVVELAEGDIAGSQVDLGLVPGGRVKLIASSNVNVFTKKAGSLTDSYTTVLVINQSDTNTLLIGTDNGTVLHHVRYRPRAIPKHYMLTTDNSISSAVTSISCHPHFSKYFLVGFTTGHIGLFHLRWPHPLITWPPQQNNQPIREVCWHLDWPSVFVCVSGEQYIHIWDLLTNDAQPVHTIKLQTRVFCLRSITNYNSSSAMVVSTSGGSNVEQVMLYSFDNSCFKRPDHLELFEKYLFSLT